MRTWQHTVTATKCGLCPVLIPKGAKVQAVTLPGVKRVSFRCEACASEVVGAVAPSGLTRISLPRLEKVLEFDYKLAQAGREVGEDG